MQDALATSTKLPSKALVYPGCERDLPPPPLDAIQVEAERERWRKEFTPPPEDSWGPPFTLVDAFAPRPPVRYAVGHLFELPSLNVIYGAPGSFKTFLLMDMACCIAAGQPWLMPLPGETCRPMSTTPGTVIWLDEDNGRRRTLDRFAALGRAYSLPKDAPIFAWSMPTPGFNASDAESVAALIRRCKDRQASLIAFDNLGTISGGVDENSSGMIAVMTGLRHLAEETGAAVVVLHHQNKAPKVQGQRLGNSLRGHSSIEASLDFALLVERETHSDFFEAQATKARGADVGPFRAIFSCDPPDLDSSMVSARFWGAKLEDGHSDWALEQAIYGVLQVKRPQNQSLLIENVKKTLPDVGKERIRSYIGSLVRAEKLDEGKGEKHTLFYDLPR